MNVHYAVALVITALISATIALIVWNRRAAPGAIGLMLFMLSDVIWASTYAVRWMVTDQQAQLFWLDATYFGVAFHTTFLIIFVLQFTNRSTLLTRRNLVLLMIMPIATLLVLWTDDWHGMFYGGIRTTGTILNGGPWFWFFVIYVYAQIFISIGLYVQAFIRSSGLYRLQTGAILSAAFLPVLANILSLAGFRPFPNLDITPFVFAVSGLIYAYSLFGFRLLDVVPIARDHLVEKMTDGIIVFDAHDRLVDINPVAQQLSGISIDAIGKFGSEILNASMQAQSNKDSAETRVVELVASDNQVHFVEIQFLPLLDKRKNINGRLFILRDISEHKQAELAQRESAARFRSLFEDSPISLWEEDFSGVKNRLDEIRANGIVDFNAYFLQHPEVVTECIELVQVLNVNKATLTLYGAANKEDLINSLAVSLPKAGNDSFRNELVLIAEGRTHFEIEILAQTMHGQTITVFLNWAVIPGHENDLSKVIVSIIDITERKQAENALRESEARTAAILRLSPIVIGVSTVAEGRYTDVNDAFEQVLGYSRTETIGRTSIEMDTWVDVDARESILREIREHGQVKNLKIRLRRKSGEVFPAMVFMTPIELQNVPCILTMMADITDRKQIEDALRESENRLHKLFETMSEGVVLIDPDGQIVQANFAAEQILGISRPEIKRSRNYIAPDWAIIRPDGTPMPPEEMAGPRAMKEKRPIKDTIMGVRRPDDSISWINVSAAPIINDASELEGVVGTFADITERKKIDDALQASEARFRTFIESAPIAVSLGRDGKIIYANPMYVEMHGFNSADELIGQPALERIAPQGRDEAIERSRKRSLGLPVEKQYELVGLRKDGTEFQMSAAVTRINLADGIANIGFFQDITERKQMEEALSKSQAFLSQVIENSGVSIFVKDRIGHYELVNGRWENETGIKREDAIGKTDHELFPGAAGEEFRKNDIRVLEQGVAVKTEEELESPAGTRYFVTIKLPLRDGNNAIIGICGISTEITELKRAADQLREAHDRLEQRVFERTADLRAANIALEKASRLKDEFLATMSHELRTPLNGILGLAQVMQFSTYGTLTEKQANAVQNIEKSGQHLLSLINEILDLTKLQSGKLELHKTSCSLASICNASLQMVNNQAEKKKQHLSFNISPDIIINVDEQRIRQVLINLLGNAIKFTPDGGSIDLAVNGILETQQVRIVVSDTGIGIKEEDFSRLFQPFTQLDARLSRNYEGTGLGLSLVKNLVEMHGGSVEVESVFGQGSRFTVILPWPEAQP